MGVQLWDYWEKFIATEELFYWGLTVFVMVSASEPVISKPYSTEDPP